MDRCSSLRTRFTPLRLLRAARSVRAARPGNRVFGLAADPNIASLLAPIAEAHADGAH